MPTKQPLSAEEAADAAGIPRVGWHEVADEFIDQWGQGEHLVSLGKTGRGKSTFNFDILNRRIEARDASVVAIATKKQDRTLSGLKWPIIREWPPTYAQRRRHRVILWPAYSKASTNAQTARPPILDALDEIMDEGSWTVYVDESGYLVETLGLRKQLDEFWNQGRSNDVTMLAGAQRPVWVNRSMVTQHSWAAIFRISDEDEARRAGELVGDKARFAPVIRSLGTHEFLLVNTVTNEGVISQIGT